jgi:hypothetical protein
MVPHCTIIVIYTQGATLEDDGKVKNEQQNLNLKLESKKSDLDVYTCTGASSPGRAQPSPWLSQFRELSV